jgi:hypothetical protein
MFKTRGDWTDLDRRFIRCRGAYRDFINTGLQPGAISERRENRFNGFLPDRKPLKRLRFHVRDDTVLKPGVNEGRKTKTNGENAGRR